jgi:uncharacterized protein (TIGR02466 family)
MAKKKIVIKREKDLVSEHNQIARSRVSTGVVMINNTKKLALNITPLFTIPVLQVELDLDLEKLTEFAFQLRDKDKRGFKYTNRGGWQSNEIQEEKHEELIRLKKEINQYLQIYQTEIFQGMVFKGNVTLSTDRMWVNINEKNHYNEWHNHTFSTLSGTYYIKHDNSPEHGNIIFKNSNALYMIASHWPPEIMELPNEVTSEYVEFVPKSNTLFIFPSWLEHKVEMNLKDESRISLAFNSNPILEKNHNG